jgi:hypothetical protein
MSGIQSETVTVIASKASPSVANVACSVEFYPFEGGPYVLTGGQISRVAVSKSLADGAGKMVVALAPGGPKGVEGAPSWSQVITPMSHMLVGMSRGNRAAVVMDGVVVAPEEHQTWSVNEQGSSAARTQIISGADFGWFFKNFNFFALTFYGVMAGTPVGDGIGLESLPGSLANILQQGLSTNNGYQSTVQIGRLWYQSVMAGASGIMAKTFVPFINGTRVNFGAAVTAQWEYYTGAYIPATDYFMAAEDTWWDKFQGVFPSPWYEFFVTTAPSGAYLASPSVALSGLIDAGTQFQLQSMPWAKPGGPALVARVNPTPIFSPPPGGSGVPGSIDSSRWFNLPLYDFTREHYGFIDSAVAFSSDDAQNFYQLNPTNLGALYGNNNSNTIPAAFLFPVAGDAASVQRYGFRPRIGTTRWVFDPKGTAAQSGNFNFTTTVLYLTAALVSYYHPGPLMARGNVVLPLTPDILIGTRFRYIPFKDNVTWDFYVEGFQHDFVFGGNSTTTLTLSRGLPTSVYNDTDMLTAVFTGNAMRQNGVYVSGLPTGTGPSLQFVITPDQIANFNQLLSNVPNTPQWSGTGTSPNG